MNLNLKKIAEITSGTLLGEDAIVGSIITDSRSHSISPSAIFVAIKGVRYDGHNFVASMYDRGLRLFMVDEGFDTQAYKDASFLKVNSTLEALQSWASYARANFKGKVIAITGSNGKTVVKEWLSQGLSSQYKVFRSPRSYNSQLGVALSLLMMGGDEQIAIIEAGISELGEMERLERMIKPNLGIFTTLGDAHGENFASEEQKLQEKLQLFKGVDKIYYNSDYLKLDQKGVDVKPLLRLKTKFEDRASKENSALVIALMMEFGFSEQQIFAQVQALGNLAMRLELKAGIDNSMIINDSYSLDINSLSIALDYLKSQSGHKKSVLILSDFLQSGMNPESLYSSVASMINKHGVDHLVGIGSEISSWAHLFDVDKKFYPSVDGFISDLKREDTLDKVILLKGNRAASFERLFHKLALKTHTTTLEVNLDLMVENLNYYKSKLNAGTKLMVMVKADAYGHGAGELSLALEREGVDYLAVAFADEGAEIKRYGVKTPIVVLNADVDSFDMMINEGLSPEIYNFSSLNSFMALAKEHGEQNLAIHLKFDTGMGRLGFKYEDIDELMIILNENKTTLNVQSVFSHLAASDDPEQDEFTLEQLREFDKINTKLSRCLGYQPLRHIANSAAIERFSSSHLEMCRLGIGLYSREFISTLATRIVHIKEMKKGETIGYNRECRLEKDTKIATIPIGYADGLNRHLGCGHWSVLVGGSFAPILGRICMDTCMIDVTDLDAKIGDRVEVFSRNKGNTLDDMAKVLDTITYEIMTSVKGRIKRVYIRE